MTKLILKRGKEKPLLQRHHWIFSGAVSQLPKQASGEILGVESWEGQPLGCAFVNGKSAIFGRMISFGTTEPLAYIEKSIVAAVQLRKQLFAGSNTTCFRLINGEGDALPGLVVDQYGSVLVIQISTLGMEKIKQHVLQVLIRETLPQAVYEKSVGHSRKEEGLKDHVAWLYGTPCPTIVVQENGLGFHVDIVQGQKTGLFLDHREMRAWVKELSKGKKVLNAFCYTGGFGLYAAAGGALKVDSIDISAQALAIAEQQAVHNGQAGVHAFHCRDVFDFLREQPLDYDLVIIDPPAFAKRKKDVIAACRGYKEINRTAMAKMPTGSLLLTSSCSYHIDSKLFQQVIFQAALEAGRTVRILGKHRLAADHPINVFHPEGDYLKSLLLHIL